MSPKTIPSAVTAIAATPPAGPARPCLTVSLCICLRPKLREVRRLYVPKRRLHCIAVRILLQFHPDWCGIPDLRAVLPNRTVRGEFAQSGHIENRHPRPLVAVLIGLTDSILALYIGLVVREKHVRIVLYRRIYQ